MNCCPSWPPCVLTSYRRSDRTRHIHQLLKMHDQSNPHPQVNGVAGHVDCIYLVSGLCVGGLGEGGYP